MRCKLLMVPAAVASLFALSAATPVHATVVNFDVHYEYSYPPTSIGQGGDNAVPLMTGDGALAGSGNFWNSVDGGYPNNVTPTNPVLSTNSPGFTTPVGGTSVAGPVYASDGSTVSPIALSVSSDFGYTSGFGIPVLDTWATQRFGSVGNFALTNVPAGTYDLYIYANPGPYFGGGGTTFTASGGGTPVGGFTSASYSGGSNTSFILGHNYVEFASLTVGAGGTITGTYTSLSPGGEGDLNGIQLVSAVPEPSSLILAGLAGLGLVFARRRMHKA